MACTTIDSAIESPLGIDCLELVLSGITKRCHLKRERERERESERERERQRERERERERERS
jgi:hypothetical protein